MKTLISLLFLAFASQAFAAGGTQAQLLSAAQVLNTAATGGPSQRLGSKLIKETIHTLKLKYDFAVQGGAIGTGNLVDDSGKASKLPKNAVVRSCIIDVATAGTTSASGTIALGTGQAGNDLKAALAAASYTGLLACVPVGTAATAIKLTADVTPTYTIATGAITAGKIYILVDYALSE